jgi:hypothetical protein
MGDMEPPAESGGGEAGDPPGSDGDGESSNEAERTSVGGFVDSRLASLVAVWLEDVRAKLTGSAPLMRLVTSHSIQVPARIGPEEAAAGVTRGLFMYVSVVSLHTLEATPCTAMPVEFVLSAKTRSRAPEMGASRPSRSKRRKLRTSGLPSVRSAGPAPKLRRSRTLLAYVSASAL